MARFLTFQDVLFTYDSLGQDLIAGLTAEFPIGWTGIVGPNGSGKTTILRLAAGEIEPQAGQIHRPGSVIYCPQRTDVPPASLGEMISSDDASARELCGRLGVREDYLQRWATLSHGERKRAQIAVALWLQPAALAVDEPSNHVDAAARDLLVERLADYGGVGLLVSHDRSMLDRLCGACMFVDPPTMVLRPGNYTHASAQHEKDLECLRKIRDEAGRQVHRLRREMIQRRETASREHKVRSKRGLAPKDHDAKEKIDRARVADSKSGASLRQLKGRMEQALAKLADLVVKNKSETGIFLPQCRSQRDYLFRLQAGSIELGGQRRTPDTLRTLEFPDIEMRPADRIALTGPNGVGKSTLIEYIFQCVNLPPEKVLYMPQELHASRAAEILQETRSLGHEQLGWVLNIVSRLGSTPHRVLQTEMPSPGEARKLLLAMGISRQVHLIIMDEPTNHLDLPSIQCLEEALSDCPCGLLLVSHDLVFLRKLTQVRWDIQPDRQSSHLSHLQVLRDWH